MSESHPETFQSHARRCLIILAAVVGVTLIMVGVSFAPLGQSLRIGLILAAACVNAFLVGGHLMHLISERKLIHTLLAFTVFFFVFLMVLTVWAKHDVPTVIPQ